MIEPLHILLWAILVGATSAGMTVAIRALPLVKRQMEKMRKPWVCDVCMSFWTVGLLGLGLGVWRGWAHVLVCGPAYPWALWVLCNVTESRGQLELPELEDEDAESN